MSKEYIVKLTKCTLVLYESDLWQLPKEVLIKAIQRGKRYRRAERVAAYEGERHNADKA